MKIANGVGGGPLAKVNSDNRLVTESITSTSSEVNLIKGRNFTLSTGEINLTTANESAMLFFSHSEDSFELLGKRMILWSSDSAAATAGTAKLKFYLGATAMVGGTAFTPLTNSVNATKNLSGTFYKGAEGASFTGGTCVSTHIVKIGEPYILPFDALYAKDVTLGVSIVPPTGNTSMDAVYALNTELINADNF